MGDYEDSTWADLRALTRERRAERAARPHLVRFSVAPDEFVGTIGAEPAKARRRRTAYKAWKLREWKGGHRVCAYCRCALTLSPNKPRSATVDHKHPLALGGDDAPWNWALACLACNRAKADMPEAEFRALLAA